MDRVVSLEDGMYNVKGVSRTTAPICGYFHVFCEKHFGRMTQFPSLKVIHVFAYT